MNATVRGDETLRDGVPAPPAPTPRGGPPGGVRGFGGAGVQAGLVELVPGDPPADAAEGVEELGSP